MSHLVLARKYRPKTFAQVVGQGAIVATLKAALTKDRIAHALLFTGSRGTGKTTVARIVAKALVCVARKEADPCGDCAQCLSIDNFSSLDVMEIDGASHTGVDDIRELREGARYQPASAKYRIYIIDEVHMLSTNAFNALLKIIEEPPPHVMFILATTEAHKIPKTILSRCQRYDFRRVGVRDIFETLKIMMRDEAFEVEDDGLLAIAHLADGGLRDALSMTEQVLALGLDRYTAEDVTKALGVVSHQAVRSVADAIIRAHVGPALAIIKEVYDQGLDLCAMMDAVADRFRALSLCAHLDTWEEAHNLVPGLGKDDYVAAQMLDKSDIKRLFAMALDGMTLMNQARKPLLALELFILRAALRPPLSDAVTITWCLQKLDALMHNRPMPSQMPVEIANGMPSLPPTAPEPRVLPAAKAPLQVALPKDPQSLFTRVVGELGRMKAGLASHLRHARPVVKGTILKLYFELSLHYDKVNIQLRDPDFSELVQRFFGPGTKIELFLEKKPEHMVKVVKTVAEADKEDKAAKEQALREQAANHPLVKKALEIFGGDITKVERLETHKVGL